ncbi:MAG TPA: alcohol dehydrogenase catalytic domain-containing protein [Solirubrobacteraceae bacterium]|nr:alcohol dehydrogenase catalytic domain-containing protein [Solirubrobacteraceae bacterium]
MRQLTFVEPGELEWQEVEDPVLEAPGEALVRPLAVAACDLDQAIVAGETPFAGPFALGHECVAEVVQAGEAVEGWSAGDRAIVSFQIACGACESCRRGRSGNCRRVARGSMYGVGPVAGNWGGALADLLRVPFPASMLVPAPAGSSPAALASVSDNVSDAYRTVAGPLASEPGADILIVGGGAASISLYAVDIARALGASQVHFLDHDPDRLELAAALGAEPVEMQATSFPSRAGSFAITVDASGDPDGLGCALRSTAPDGTCTSVGIYYSPETPVPLLEMYAKGVSFYTGRPHARGLIPAVMELIAAGRIQPERVTTAVVPWEAAAEELLNPRTKLVIARD